MTDEKPDGPPEQTPETTADTELAAELSEEAGHEERAVGTRRGMFGAAGTGDTSGYGGLVRPVLMPGSAERPYGGWFDEVADRLDPLIERVVIHRGEITFHVHRDNLLEVAGLLRDDVTLRFEFFSGVSGVHYPEDEGRELHAVYHLGSMTYNRRIRVEVSAPDADPQVPSLVGIYPAADWHERETYDMFGLVFTGHPALTRILMPDDWPGHPQRKDYPLGGIPVEYKGGSVPPPDQRRSYN
ncbi:NADH-quinone oxidoreductase subunit C [Nocardioides sp. GY 10113]|uniref:NADH-quinone oxidoreductase subunit C n=1 Tax=Nocardioides sp. GY 10113 TaxID=2569761 RepID=UPI0010A78F8D|nr:NADH-quinone oxidoreductase subunit C [Nocardioides sp. GY 10113]TIC89272.1 NADH-quinone oxidoreductase subunit C [Nocardioides sp. GY 10113]